MPKFSNPTYSEEEVKLCQEDAPNQNCTDCQSSVAECLSNLSETRESALKQERPI